jgi:hypothetical protein
MIGRPGYSSSSGENSDMIAEESGEEEDAMYDDIHRKQHGF